MKEIIYKFNNLGCYSPDTVADFKTENHLKLIIEPHQFQLKISDEILRNSSCKGYIIEVSDKGEVCFYDYENNLLAKAQETHKKFAQVEFLWNQDKLSLNFGHIETVDHYPNCDGEYDRWGTEWITEYEVTLDTSSNEIKTVIF